jgi:hypothetical protein
VDSTSLGLDALALQQIMSLATFANALQSSGAEVTGRSIYNYLAEEPGLQIWPDGAEVQCGASASYPSVCTFTLPFAEYAGDGRVTTVPGLEAVSSLELLP